MYIYIYIYIKVCWMRTARLLASGAGPALPSMIHYYVTATLYYDSHRLLVLVVLLILVV